MGFDFLHPIGVSGIGKLESGYGWIRIIHESIRDTDAYAAWLHDERTQAFHLENSVKECREGEVVFSVSTEICDPENISLGFCSTDPLILLLCTDTYPVEKFRFYLWNLKKEEEKLRKAESLQNHANTPLNKSLPDGLKEEFGPCPEILYKRHATDIPLSMLPSLEVSEASKGKMAYFSVCEAVTIPGTCALGWRFVNAPLAQNEYAGQCSFGRFAYQGRICAFAYVIDEKSFIGMRPIPGFKHQKTPDGQGVWVYIQEV